MTTNELKTLVHQAMTNAAYNGYGHEMMTVMMRRLATDLYDKDSDIQDYLDGKDLMQSELFQHIESWRKEHRRG